MIEAEGRAVVGQSLGMREQGAGLVSCGFVLARGGGRVAGGLVMLRDCSRIGSRSVSYTHLTLPTTPYV